MEWWLWLIVVLALMALGLLTFIYVQGRRRGGGVVSARRQPPGGAE